MTLEFRDKWDNRINKKGNNVIAGVEFATFGMRDKMTLPKGVDEKEDIKTFREATLRAVESAARNVAAIKCNAAYFQTPEKMQVLKEAAELGKSLGLVLFLDAKISDIGSTNDAWIFSHMEMGWDVTTIAPYAANIGETVKLVKDKERKLAAIGMGFMSNPEYIQEALFVKDSDVSVKFREIALIHKNSLKDAKDNSEIAKLNVEFAELVIDLVVNSDESQFILDRLYEYRIKELVKAGAEGIVVGATLKADNVHLQNTLKFVRENDLYILGPGVGAQGGTIDGFADILEANGVDFARVGPNIGRDFMFPKGMNSTFDDREEALKNFAQVAGRRLLKNK
jgi:orotidine-5'-phosphate decarboxylase